MTRPAKPLTRRDVALALAAQSPNPEAVSGIAGARKLVQHESREQRALWQWVQRQPWREDFYHWPNERRNREEAVRLASEGVRRGPVDNWLLLPVQGRPGAVSELKRVGATRSAVKPEQRAFLLRREAQGWAVGVHRGWEESAEFFRRYVAGEWFDDGGWWR